jgi:hypothetical protein
MPFRYNTWRLAFPEIRLCTLPPQLDKTHLTVANRRVSLPIPVNFDVPFFAPTLEHQMRLEDPTFLTTKRSRGLHEVVLKSFTNTPVVLVLGKTNVSRFG